MSSGPSDPGEGPSSPGGLRPSLSGAAVGLTDVASGTAAAAEIEARLEQQLFNVCFQLAQQCAGSPPGVPPPGGMRALLTLRSILAQHLAYALQQPFPTVLGQLNLTRTASGRVDLAMIRVASQQGAVPTEASSAAPTAAGPSSAPAEPTRREAGLRVIKTLFLTAEQVRAGGVHASLLELGWALMAGAISAQQLHAASLAFRMRMHSPYVVGYDAVSIQAVPHLEQARDANVLCWSHVEGPGLVTRLAMRRHTLSLAGLGRKLHDLHAAQPTFPSRAHLLSERPLGSRVVDLRVVAQVMWESLQGVAHLHGLGILHNDIKPENLLIWQRQDDSDGGGTPASEEEGSKGGVESRGLAADWVVRLSDLGGAGLVDARGVDTQAWLHSTPFCSSVRRRRLARGDASTDVACDLYALGASWAFTLLGATFLVETCSMLNTPLDAQPEWRSLAEHLAWSVGSGPSLIPEPPVPASWAPRLDDWQAQGAAGMHATRLLGVIAQTVSGMLPPLGMASAPGLVMRLRPIVETVMNASEEEALLVLDGGPALFPFSSAQCSEMVVAACASPGAIAVLAEAHTTRAVHTALLRARGSGSTGGSASPSSRAGSPPGSPQAPLAHATPRSTVRSAAVDAALAALQHMLEEEAEKQATDFSFRPSRGSPASWGTGRTPLSSRSSGLISSLDGSSGGPASGPASSVGVAGELGFPASPRRAHSSGGSLRELRPPLPLPLYTVPSSGRSSQRTSEIASGSQPGSEGSGHGSEVSHSQQDVSLTLPSLVLPPRGATERKGPPSGGRLAAGEPLPDARPPTDTGLPSAHAAAAATSEAAPELTMPPTTPYAQMMGEDAAQQQAATPEEPEGGQAGVLGAATHAAGAEVEAGEEAGTTLQAAGPEVLVEVESSRMVELGAHTSPPSSVSDEASGGTAGEAAAVLPPEQAPPAGLVGLGSSSTNEASARMSVAGEDASWLRRVLGACTCGTRT